MDLIALLRRHHVLGALLRQAWPLCAWVIASIALGSAGLAHAGAAAGAIVDDGGSAVRLPVAPRRIVSLLPSLTEAVCVLDACDRLVGVDRWSNWPESVQGLPRLGGLDDAPLERIVALRPDLVLLAPSSKVAPRLRQLGLVVAELDARDLPGVERLLHRLATLLGRPEAGPARWQVIVAELGEAARSVPASARGRSVYVEVSSSPHAAGESSYIGEILTQQGARNIVSAALGPFPKLNPEFVVRARPELIIVSAGEARALARRPGWASVPAVKAGRVCALNPQDMDALSRPGPRLPEAARVLARCLRQAWGGPP
jgi:iron complex transport system substrate-binding protein